VARHERWVALAHYTRQLNAGSVSHCSGNVSRQALATPVPVAYLAEAFAIPLRHGM
jgi:hypothetical protein